MTYFGEPTYDDPTWAEDGELLTAWLGRSTMPLARETRRFYNENLARLPEGAGAIVSRKIHEHARRGFFELLVGRVLQELGAVVEYEPATPRGRRLDYLARFPDAPVYVEAVSPVLNAAAGDDASRDQPLTALVKRLAPAHGWIIAITSLPPLGPNDSRRDLRRQLLRLFGSLPATPPVSSDRASLTLRARVGRGCVELECWARPGQATGFIGPAVGYIDDVPYRVADTVRNKADQARGAEHPVLLAIDAAWMGTSLERFDIGLFGHTVAHIRAGQQVATSFDPDGVFGERRREPPTFAGVLAFVEVGERGGPPPVLYLHPRFAGRLPAALDALEQRSLRPEGIEVRAPRGPNVMDRISFAIDDRPSARRYG